MVISHRHRYLYFVVPKCASATVRTSLQHYTDIGYPVTDGVQHMSISAFMKTEHAGLMDDYFKFTFVRNPYDRLYSGFMQDRFAATQSPKWARVKKPIFDVVGDDFNRYMLEYVQRADRLNAWDWICFCPMHAFAYLDGVRRVDWIGRAEHVDLSLGELSRRLGVPIERKQNLNVNVQPSNGLKHLSRYCRATVQMVNELYADDFRLFGYEMLDPKGFAESCAPVPDATDRKVPPSKPC